MTLWLPYSYLWYSTGYDRWAKTVPTKKKLDKVPSGAHIPPTSATATI